MLIHALLLWVLIPYNLLLLGPVIIGTNYKSPGLFTINE